MNNLRILFTNTGAWGTGSGTVVDGVIKELLEQEIDVNVFFPDSKFESTDIDKYYGKPDLYKIWQFPISKNEVDLYTFPLIIPDPHPRNYRDAWTFKDLTDAQLNLYMSEFKKEIIQQIDQFNPHIIECQHIWAMDHVIMELGHPYICVAHHSDQLGFLRDKRMRKMAIDSASNADYIFAISEYVRDEVLEFYPVDPDRVITIGNGYDQEVFKPVNVDREKLFKEFKLPINDDLPIISFAGKISKTKGIDTLLKANKFLQEKKPAHLIIMGAGNIETILVELEKSEYSELNVHYIGHQSAETLARFHNVSSLSVMPSNSEGFGISALEAMGCGTPMVVTKTGGPDLFSVGEIVPCQDPESLAGAMIKILNLPESEHNKLSANAHLAAKHFSWKKITDTRLFYYGKMLEVHNPEQYELVMNHIEQLELK